MDEVHYRLLRGLTSKQHLIEQFSTMGDYYNLARGTMEIIHLRDALSCLRDAVDRTDWPEGKVVIITFLYSQANNMVPDPGTISPKRGIMGPQTLGQ